jgi:hypothetical protein
MEMDRGKLPIVRRSEQNLAIVPVTSGGAPAPGMALVAVVMAGVLLQAEVQCKRL